MRFLGGAVPWRTRILILQYIKFRVQAAGHILAANQTLKIALSEYTT